MKLAVVCIIIGIFLLRARLEEIATAFFPDNSEMIIGIGLIVYGVYRMHKKMKLLNIWSK